MRDLHRQHGTGGLAHDLFGHAAEAEGGAEFPPAAGVPARLLAVPGRWAAASARRVCHLCVRLANSPCAASLFRTISCAWVAGEFAFAVCPLPLSRGWQTRLPWSGLRVGGGFQV